jgi:hypothetical protein
VDKKDRTRTIDEILRATASDARRKSTRIARFPVARRSTAGRSSASPEELPENDPDEHRGKHHPIHRVLPSQMSAWTQCTAPQPVMRSPSAAARIEHSPGTALTRIRRLARMRGQPKVQSSGGSGWASVAAAAFGRQSWKRRRLLTRDASRQRSIRTLWLDRHRFQHRVELSFAHVASALASTHANQEHQGPPRHQPQPADDASTRTGLVLQRIRESDVRAR